jgi:predicted NBD/HSP70 family sugar kinase
MRIYHSQNNIEEQKLMHHNIPSGLKLSNRKIVYQLLSRKDGMSRADIARMTGISSATVLKIMEHLKKMDIVYYDKKEPISSIGRKPIPVRFNRNHACIIAICMEGMYTSIGIVNIMGDVILSKEIKVLDVERFIQTEFYSYVDSIIDESAIDKDKLIGIGLALPAAIDPQNKKVVRAPLFHETRLAALNEIMEELSSRYSLPVFVENDVNAAAFGEYRYIYSEHTRDIIYISLGSGVGGGLILNGEIWRGQNASAGEFGYMVFERESSLPLKEFGWLESKVNINVLQELFQIDMRNSIQKPLGKRVARYLSRYISLAILNISAVLDIQTVVLGGILTKYMSNYLVDGLYREMKTVSEYIPELVYGKLEKPALAGLSCIVSDKLLDRFLGS